MKDAALLVDAGNTRLKWGVLEEGLLAHTGVVRHETLREAGFTPLARQLTHHVAKAQVCNVAGTEFGAKLAEFIESHCGVTAEFARAGKSGHGITSGYRRPSQLGVDRWAAMIGARAETKAAFCIVDAGTAVTIDAVDRSGQHIGGQIIPGLYLMADALRAETDAMHRLDIRRADHGTGMTLFAHSTERAVPAGTLNAICGAVERSVRFMRAAGMRPRVYVTGGGAPRIMEELDLRVLHRPHLVLQGLAAMVQNRT